jgi:hypothetical protein
MLFQVIPPSVENSHRITFPVWPESVRVPLLVPEQTVAFELTVPPTVGEVTVTIALPDVVEGQEPFWITA